jgi:hypothetical protein
MRMPSTQYPPQELASSNAAKSLIGMPDIRTQLRKRSEQRIEEGYAMNFILDCLPDSIPEPVDRMLRKFHSVLDY